MGKPYDADFKQQAVRLVKELDKSIAQVARELDMPPNTLSGWVKAAQVNPEQPFVGSGH